MSDREEKMKKSMDQILEESEQFKQKLEVMSDKFFEWLNGTIKIYNDAIATGGNYDLLERMLTTKLSLNEKTISDIVAVVKDWKMASRWGDEGAVKILEQYGLTVEEIMTNEKSQQFVKEDD